MLTKLLEEKKAAVAECEEIARNGEIIWDL